MGVWVCLALSEDFEDLEKHTTMLACGIPYAQDIPDKFDPYYIETPREFRPFGAAGCIRPGRPGFWP